MQHLKRTRLCHLLKIHLGKGLKKPLQLNVFTANVSTGCIEHCIIFVYSQSFGFHYIAHVDHIDLTRSHW